MSRFRMPLPTAPYRAEEERKPRDGRHILATHDAETIVVYQAYRPSIADAAVADQRFGGGGFRFERMSWVKPNFLWMMYRAGWATKPGQERILAVRMRRTLFDGVLAAAIHSSFGASPFEDRAEWQAALRSSDVRLQWDPAHAPSGAKLARRAIQLGLRGDWLRRYATECVEVTDVTPFAAEQRELRDSATLSVPVETLYPVPDPAVRRGIGLDASG